MKALSLYIGGSRVDLADDSLILLNYTAEDLSNPTNVKNTYSQSVKIEGTDHNNALFGHIWRLDHITSGGEGVGADFDARRKTPFTIYDEANDIVESGYVKLESITTQNERRTYNVRLFGGLGSFIYSLSYNEQGEKMTLADLEYLDTTDSETELNFKINTANVNLAWGQLQIQSEAANKWNVVNFAPCYNGIPEGEFSADAALVKPEGVGLKSTIDKYTTRNGWALVHFKEKQDEWAAKDLRSYLQRPVFGIRSFMKAIAKPKNNGGFSVDVSEVLSDKVMGKKLSRMWMTLPMLSDIKAFQENEGDVSISSTSTPTTAISVAKWFPAGTGTLPKGTLFRGDFSFRLDFNIVAPASVQSLGFQKQKDGFHDYMLINTTIFVQVVAYNGDIVVGGSQVVSLGSSAGYGDTSKYNTTAKIAEKAEFRPDWDFEGVYGEHKDIRLVRSLDPDTFTTGEINLQVGECAGVTRYETKVYVLRSESQKRRDGSTGPAGYFTTRKDSIISVWENRESPTKVSTSTTAEDRTANISYRSTSKLRSNTLITKRLLLSKTPTPADYLLGLCKMLGLYILYNKDDKSVRIVTRNTLFDGEVVDIDDRVDRGSAWEILPYVFDAKWYDMALKPSNGMFEKEYKEIVGKDYGTQRIDTGYQFDSKAKNLFDNSCYNSGAPALERGYRFNIMQDASGAIYYPSPFLLAENTYTLWNAQGETLDTPISYPPLSVVDTTTYYNEERHGFDIEGATKMQFHDKTGKGVKGDGVLLFYNGVNRYDAFKLTDDLSEMDNFNDGKPCWILDKGTGVDVPNFSRYTIDRATQTITHSLDFGMPQRLNIPAVTYLQGITLYDIAWRAYLSDRYNPDTKVVKVKVLLRGMRVGVEMLRKFYYFGGSLWALNKISNYSLTTDGLTDCEFVKVHNLDNYTKGQIYGKE